MWNVCRLTLAVRTKGFTWAACSTHAYQRLSTLRLVGKPTTFDQGAELRETDTASQAKQVLQNFKVLQQGFSCGNSIRSAGCRYFNGSWAREPHPLNYKNKYRPQFKITPQPNPNLNLTLFSGASGHFRFLGN